MLKKIKIDSEIEGRGRNGWIKVRSANVWHLLGVGAKATGEVHVEFRSKRIGDTAPLLLKGNQDDILKLFEAITAKIRAGNAKRQNPAA